MILLKFNEIIISFRLERKRKETSEKKEEEGGGGGSGTVKSTSSI